MARQSKNNTVCGRYFKWLVYKHANGTYWADGRGNNAQLNGNGLKALGRYSLGSRSLKDAMSQVHKLDTSQAVLRGLAPHTAMVGVGSPGLPIAVGYGHYLKYVGRPAVAGGADPTTVKRYGAIFSKLDAWCVSSGITFWNQFSDETLDSYLAWLDGEGYEYATEYMEGTTIKQCVSYLIKSGHLPAHCAVTRSLPKPQGTNTYCYTGDEVQAMIELCDNDPELNWLADVIVGLSHTGMRISEFASLTWSDIDLKDDVIVLTHKGHIGTQAQRQNARRTKGKRSRIIPIHPTLKSRLLGMKRGVSQFAFRAQKGGALHADNLRNILIRDVLLPLKTKFPQPPETPSIVDGRLHSFRHFFCSQGIRSGISPTELMAALGHRDSKMIQHYYHQNSASSAAMIKKARFLPTNTTGALPEEKSA